jgi:hypothetical protein
METGRFIDLGHGVTVGVRISDRARRCRIQVEAGGVTLVRPRRVGESAALRLLHDNASWVVAQVRRAAAARAVVAGPPGSVLLGGLHVPCHELPAGAALASALRTRARAVIDASVARHAERMGVEPARVQIRAQRTRWGSCSRTGRLSFNWRLVHAPPEVLDYVVVHELAHMVHPNHSQDFWTLVHAHCPGYPAHKRWLRRHAALLAGNPVMDESSRKEEFLHFRLGHLSAGALIGNKGACRVEGGC